MRGPQSSWVSKLLRSLRMSCVMLSKGGEGLIRECSFSTIASWNGKSVPNLRSRNAYVASASRSKRSRFRIKVPCSNNNRYGESSRRERRRVLVAICPIACVKAFRFGPAISVDREFTERCDGMADTLIYLLVVKAQVFVSD